MYNFNLLTINGVELLLNCLKKSGWNLSSSDSALCPYIVFEVDYYGDQCGCPQSYCPLVSLNILTQKSPHQSIPFLEDSSIYHSCYVFIRKLLM